MALLEYAEHRGLKVETLERAGWVYHDEGKRKGYIEIPYRNATGQWKVRYRSADPNVPKRDRWRDEKGEQFHLYNPLRLGPGQPEVWFAEGETDTVTLMELGLPVIGIHGAQNVPDEDDKEDREETRRFRRSWAILFRESEVVVMFDNDEEGIKNGRRLAMLLHGRVFDRWDDEHEDVNAWHKADPKRLRRAVMDFRWLE